jgi:hypothetical protein
MAQAVKKDYTVGYARPPVCARFRKGQSGNPSGRPRCKHKPERAKELALQEAYRLVTVREGDEVKKMPAIQAIHRAQVALAAKGNGPAQRAVLRIVQAIENERFELAMELLKAAIEYKEFARDLERKRDRGLIADDPAMPRSDDMLINMQTGEVVILHPDFTGDLARKKRRE